MCPIRQPPTHPLQILLTLRILTNSHNKPLLFKPQQQPLNKLLIPRNLSRHINRKNKPRENSIQIRKNLLTYLLNFLLTNPRHPNQNQTPLIFFTFFRPNIYTIIYYIKTYISYNTRNTTKISAKHLYRINIIS